MEVQLSKQMYLMYFLEMRKMILWDLGGFFAKEINPKLHRCKNIDCIKLSRPQYYFATWAICSELGPILDGKINTSINTRQDKMSTNLALIWNFLMRLFFLHELVLLTSSQFLRRAFDWGPFLFWWMSDVGFIKCWSCSKIRLGSIMIW